MKYVGLIVVYLGVLINIIVFLKCYAKFENVLRIKSKFLKYSIVFMFSLLLFLIDLKVNVKIKIPVIYFFLIIMFKLIFKDKTFNTFLKTFLVYAVLIMCDFLISIILIVLPSFQVSKDWLLLIFKGIYTIVVSLIVFKIFEFDKFNLMFKRMTNIFNEKVNYFLFTILFLSFLGFYIISYYNFFRKSAENFMFSFVLFCIFMILLVLLISEFFKIKTKDEEQKQLLKIMGDYEIILDKTRENRHEMINNLLVLKGEKNKNSRRYNDILDELIKQYDTNKMSSYSGLYKLPNGLKGLVYYKIARIKNNDVNFRTIISDKMYDEFNNLDTKIYYKVCKIIGILIDNAVEASINSKEKTLLIYIYEQCNGNIVISIENSYNALLDIHDINKKGYSTKGKNRGLGLFIANRTIEEEKLLRLRQYVFESTFISELKIIKECNLAEEEQENVK